MEDMPHCCILHPYVNGWMDDGKVGMKLYRRKESSYVYPQETYRMHSYCIKPVDREFLHNLFTHGVAIHVCQSNMKAQYYVVRIRVILHKRDRDVQKSCKFAIRECEAIGWSKSHFPEVKSATPDFIQRARDLGFVTHQVDVPEEEVNGIRGKMASLLKEEGMGGGAILESEDAIREYIMSLTQEEEELE